LSAEEFRREFPSLGDTVHLASCSQGAASNRLLAAISELTYSLHAEGAPWHRWMAEVEAARAAFAARIGADTEEIAVLGSASEGAYQVASTQDWSARAGLVTTTAEFPSVAHVWLAQRPGGAQVTFAVERDGVVEPDGYSALIDGGTGLVSVPMVTYRNGARLPVREVIETAHAAGARVFVDAYQAAGVLPIDVRELGCDYLVAGALKYLLGLPGIAFLYVRDGQPDLVPPALTGWFGRVDPFAFDPELLDFAAGARRLEVGTPAIPSAYAANAGLAELDRLDQKAVEEHVTGIARAAHQQLEAAGERMFSPADDARRGPQVAILDEEPDRLAEFLGRRRIVTAPRGNALRMSFHYYNNLDDVAAVVTALADYRRGQES
jgi:selenocysteine lyase/cysteine desulfurase